MSELKTGCDLVPQARVEGDTIVAAVRGEVDLHNSPELRGVLLDFIGAHAPRRIILNVAQVPYMDSSAVAVMVEALQKLRKAGGTMLLTNLQPRVKGLLEIARLDTVFVLCKDEAEALETLKKKN